MTTIEEILIRLGVIDQASPGVEKVKQRVEGAAKEGGKWFDHVGSKAGAFHKAIERITEASPVLGNALKFALDPVAGTMMLATAAFVYAEKKIDELNQRLDKMEAITRSPMSNLAKSAIAATGEIAKLNAELDRYHKQAALEGRRAEREDAARNDSESAKAQLAIDEDRINKRKAQDQEQLKSRLSGRALVVAQYELEVKYAKELHDLRVKSAQKQLDTAANAKQAASEEFQKAKDNLALWERLATDKGQKDLIAGIDKKKQENASAEKRLSGYEALDEIFRKKREGILDATGFNRAITAAATMFGGPIAGFVSKSVNNSSLNKWQTAETENYKTMMDERRHILERNKQIAEEEVRLASTNEELKKAQERFKSATDELRKFENGLQDAKRNLGQIQQTAPQVVQPLPNNAALDDRFRATIGELANSGQWVARRAFGGRVLGTFWRPGPFAGIARAIQMEEAMATRANLAGNIGLRNVHIDRARVLRDMLGGTDALKDSEFLDSISKDMAAIKQMAAGVGLNVNPANGK